MARSDYNIAACSAFFAQQVELVPESFLNDALEASRDRSQANNSQHISTLKNLEHLLARTLRCQKWAVSTAEALKARVQSFQNQAILALGMLQGRLASDGEISGAISYFAHLDLEFEAAMIGIYQRMYDAELASLWRSERALWGFVSRLFPEFGADPYEDRIQPARIPQLDYVARCQEILRSLKPDTPSHPLFGHLPAPSSCSSYGERKWALLFPTKISDKGGIAGNSPSWDAEFDTSQADLLWKALLSLELDYESLTSFRWLFQAQSFVAPYASMNWTLVHKRAWKIFGRGTHYPLHHSPDQWPMIRKRSGHSLAPVGTLYARKLYTLCGKAVQWD